VLLLKQRDVTVKELDRPISFLSTIPFVSSVIIYEYPFTDI
jgi:hypothetical protein